MGHGATVEQVGTGSKAGCLVRCGGALQSGRAYRGFTSIATHTDRGLTRTDRYWRAMNVYPQIADAAWLRLVIVGLDILAVVVTVRVCSVLTAWWRAWRAPQPVPAAVRRL